MGSAVHLLSLNEGPDIVLDKPIVLFGRHPECDVLLNSRKISRKHCCIAVVGNGLIVRDLGSTNGVKVNGAVVTEGPLAIGDEVTIGIFSYKVALAAEPPPRIPKPEPAGDHTLNENPTP